MEVEGIQSSRESRDFAPAQVGMTRLSLCIASVRPLRHWMVARLDLQDLLPKGITNQVWMFATMGPTIQTGS